MLSLNFLLILIYKFSPKPFKPPVLNNIKEEVIEINIMRQIKLELKAKVLR